MLTHRVLFAEEGKMGMTYRIEAKLGLVVERHTGPVTMEDLRKYSVALRADPAYRPDMRRLVDLTGAHVNISFSELVAYKPWRESIGSALQMALVGTSDHEYGMARMYEMVTEDSRAQIRAFRTRAEACAWLGLTPDQIPD